MKFQLSADCRPLQLPTKPTKALLLGRTVGGRADPDRPVTAKPRHSRSRPVDIRQMLHVACDLAVVDIKLQIWLASVESEISGRNTSAIRDEITANWNSGLCFSSCVKSKASRKVVLIINISPITQAAYTRNSDGALISVTSRK